MSFDAAQSKATSTHSDAGSGLALRAAVRRRPDPLLHLTPDALRDGELAARALGVSIDEAAAWLAARGRGDGGRIGARLERRLAACAALTERLADRPTDAPIADSVEAAAALLTPRLARLDVEELHVLALDGRNRVLGSARIARGAVNQVLVTAREVFRPLVALGAARAIVAHNHPSGDPTPSEADAELTARLVVAGELLGIALVDHLVLARRGHHSFARAGALVSARRGVSARRCRARDDATDATR